MWISLLIAGNHGAECSMEGDGLRAEVEFFAFIWLVSITTGDSRVSHSSGRFGLLDFILDGYLHVQSAKVEVWFQLECAPEQLVSMVTVDWQFFYVAKFFLWYPNLIICYANM